MKTFEFLYLISQYLIFVGALFYTIFACLQWRAIRQQASIAREGFSVTNRPWILVFTAKWPSGAFPIPDENDTAPKGIGCTYQYKNYGSSPGFLTAAWSTMIKIRRLEDLPPEPIYREINSSFEIAIAPDTPTHEVPVALEPNGTLMRDEILEIERRESFLYVYGFVRYRDSLNNPHETRFGAVYWVPLFQEDSRELRRAGPAAYNRHT
jgi:hypothetical protein